ncbi:translation initiation factor IF-2-like [Moschus berezovskii]|uniref:translation initiation factor IF-2-like n=1 Tax=Moschus berezovskii TaxID=68408 RepID=UPI0024443B19|nr:translation initiation factor IF-2-like [Moschus berezovskii]
MIRLTRRFKWIPPTLEAHQNSNKRHVPTKVGTKCHHTKRSLSKALTKQPRRLVIPKPPQTLTTIPTGISTKLRKAVRAHTARKPNVPLGSYVLPSPAPASAAAFLTEIALRKLRRPRFPAPRPAHCTTDTPSRPEALPGLPTSEDGETGKLGAPLGQTESSQSRPPPPGPRAPVREEGGKLPRRRRPGSSPAQRSPARRGREPPRAPSRGAGPRAPEGAPAPRKSAAHSPTAPRGTRAPAPPTPAARRPRTQGRGGPAARAQKSLSSPIGGTARVPG